MNNYIDIEFYYNGDLGKLQHQSEANIKTVNMLAMNNIITNEDRKQLLNEICNYFKEQLQQDKLLNFITH